MTAAISPQVLHSHTPLPPPRSRCHISAPHRAPWPQACCTNTCQRLSQDWQQGPSYCMYWKLLGTGTYKKNGRTRLTEMREWRNVLLKNSCFLCACTVQKPKWWRKVDSIILLSQNTDRALCNLLTQEAFSHKFNGLLTLYELQLNRFSILLNT